MQQAVTEAPSLEVFIQNLPGNVYRRIRRPDGSYVFEYLSSGLFRQFEIDHRLLLAQDPVVFDWIHPDDRSRFVSDLEMSAATLGLLDHRIRVVGADGRVHWARGIARPSRRPDGCVVWDGIVIDVTREVEAEAALMVAKAEADRAHATATRLIMEAADRLDQPIARLRRLSTDQGSGLDDKAKAEFVQLLADIESALGDLAPEAMLHTGAARKPRLPALTTRQSEVLRLMRGGMTNKLIAQKLSITPGTVKLHVAAVLRSMNVRSRRQLPL